MGSGFRGLGFRGFWRSYPCPYSCTAATVSRPKMNRMCSLLRRCVHPPRGRVNPRPETRPSAPTWPPLRRSPPQCGLLGSWGAAESSQRTASSPSRTLRGSATFTLPCSWAAEVQISQLRERERGRLFLRPPDHTKPPSRISKFSSYFSMLGGPWVF